MRNSGLSLLNIALLALGISLGTKAAVYQEVDGRVVIEAENFDKRTVNADDGREWKIIPSEDAGSGTYSNARGGKYMQTLPDAGQNKNNADLVKTDPALDYKVQLSKGGEYRLWLRWTGHDGASDSLYAYIVEIPTPQWYRYSDGGNPDDGDFSTKTGGDGQGWDGIAAPDSNSGGGGEEAALFNVPSAGTYTIRITQREDGCTLDALILQLASMAPPTDPGPAESQIAGGADSDQDGIPDFAETHFGFNPNDPSDAAKDFDSDGVSNLDEYKAGTNPVDVTKPTIVSAAPSSSFNTITLTFSEELDPASATAVANYTISPALAVTAATYIRKVVTLTTANQTPNATAYTVTVKGVRDLSKNEVATDTKATVFSYLLGKAGVLKFSHWTGISGNPVDNLLNDPRYPATPTAVGAVFSFNSREIFPTDALDNYGAVIEGYLTPAESGDYDFFLRSDDASQLFLSTDENPANLAMIAEETGCCAAFMEPSTGDAATTSTPIALVANRRYYIRVIYKEGGGGDFAQVAWRKSTDTTPAASLTPIPGRFLSSPSDLPLPAEGAFTTRTPAPGARNVSPGPEVRIVHRDGKTAWTAENVSLKVDGVRVTPTFTKDGSIATIVYKPSGLFASKSKHTLSLGYVDPGGNPATLESEFEVTEYKGPVKDAVKGYDAILLGTGKQTDDKGGLSGAAGDRGIDLGIAGAPVQVIDASFLTAVNTATAADELSVSMWIKKYDIADSSAFWFSSPTESRVFQAHTPWSNNNVYFDTAGCCSGDQRINASIDTLATYSGDVVWWNSWHHFAFTKKADAKRIWIDGTLFLEGSNPGVLSKDINQLMIAADNAGNNRMHAVIDDFAVYAKALTPADVTALKGGSKPSALPASTGLLAYWDFNGPLSAAGAKFTKFSVSGGNLTIEWTGTGTLQKADAITGPWTDVTGATSPRSISVAGNAAFYRIKQ